MSRNQNRVEDWLSRVTIPDLYPRKDDPFQPAAALISPAGGTLSTLLPPPSAEGDFYAGNVTDPAARPVVFQQAINYQVSVGLNPIPIANQSFQVDAITIDVISTAGSNVFFGYGAGVNIASGIEVRAGIPQTLSPDNTREQWELQRTLEAIAAILAADRGLNPIGTFKSPRVVLDANSYYLVAPVAGPTVVAIMLWLPPQYQ